MRDYEKLIVDLQKMRSTEYCVITSAPDFPAYKILREAICAIEELLAFAKTDTVYGYPVKELIAFAAACRENGVEEKDLKTFANNVRFAFEIVHAEAEAAFQRAMWGIGGKGVK